MRFDIPFYAKGFFAGAISKFTFALVLFTRAILQCVFGLKFIYTCDFTVRFCLKVLLHVRFCSAFFVLRFIYTCEFALRFLVKGSFTCAI